MGAWGDAQGVKRGRDSEDKQLHPCAGKGSPSCHLSEREVQPGKHTTSLGLTDVLVHLCQHQQTHTNTVHQALGLYTVLASLERQGERKKERERERGKERRKERRV